MLRHKSDVRGYAIHARDGFIGTISDFLFDDTSWVVRWLVVDTGNWLPGRKVLLPPSALEHVNHIANQFNVKLSRQRVRDSPDAETDLPVSRQAEADIYNYYGWSPYWGDGSYMGLVGYGGGYAIDAPVPSLSLMQREQAIDDARRPRRDPALRSAEEIVGYHIHASDGAIGHVADLLVDDTDWDIQYLVVEAGNWWAGNKLLISPLSVQEIQWSDKAISLDLDRKTVRDSIPYNASDDVPPRQHDVHRYDGRFRTRESVRSTPPQS
jgi:sporulation protein YlmC with PRC-barrel domain